MQTKVQDCYLNGHNYIEITFSYRCILSFAKYKNTDFNSFWYKCICLLLSILDFLLVVIMEFENMHMKTQVNEHLLCMYKF